jgi:anti-anti-sigma factor
VSTTPYSQDSDAATPPIVRQYTLAGARVIEVGGELDLDTLPPLRQALEAAADAQPTTVLALSGVTFADSSALNLLLLFSQSTDLRLAAPSEAVLRLLRITGTEKIVRIHPSVEEATSA